MNDVCRWPFYVGKLSLNIETPIRSFDTSRALLAIDEIIVIITITITIIGSPSSPLSSLVEFETKDDWLD